ncbi:ABC transporter family protein [Clostridium argentinense CDC 2741]|uniref:ABC transporter family protein n=1 Tax=Clostridium argentinense CDC 2741 TaxID=1418104 RepID=A0A0C1U0U0_9CLOT|nr:ABC transporter ATP-binding protein [Clostridium argentinense]ARC83841.1 ABC transporter [Clostridium argentinense]KIE45128.1 ABC transporter family protein [Clostridium argentinense CDC 2741]NFF39749.1 ABC transporter ATP-binding protein [Clostridium argentinense]NFP49749.1 ABC transporter ATP-binding protein [Clostridium argentinense]NFP72150.1 ABC transporter ATP-binding protein [Clostridium argentinense]
MIKLSIKDLQYKHILKNINLEINKGDFVGIIGPNGSGKSTLLKNIYRVCTPDKGEIFLNNINLKKLSNKEIAKNMSVVAQENKPEFDFKVVDMVLIGRFAHKSLFENNNSNDIELAENCLEKVGMLDFKDRNFLNLSGGEKQRVLIARALAQESDFMILDEPTNHLDIGYQLQIMDIIKSQNLTVFSAIHDLNIACYYCDKIIIIKDGVILDFGKPEDILNENIVYELFGLNCQIERNKLTNKLNIIYIPNSFNNDLKSATVI